MIKPYYAVYFGKFAFPNERTDPNKKTTQNLIGITFEIKHFVYASAHSLQLAHKRQAHIDKCRNAQNAIIYCMMVSEPKRREREREFMYASLVCHCKWMHIPKTKINWILLLFIVVVGWRCPNCVLLIYIVCVCVPVYFVYICIIYRSNRISCVFWSL